MNWLDPNRDWIVYAAENEVDGFLHPHELFKLVCLADGRDVLEIGAYRGLSAWGMAHTAKSVLSVDTFKACTNGQDQEAEFTTLEAYDKATAGLKNVRRIPATSEEAATRIDVQFGLVFLDAMHDYENVKADIERWWPFVEPGGVLAMHDYRHWDFPGVEKAADEKFGPAPEGTTIVTLRWIVKPEETTTATGDV